jgi:hypothetical protein
MKPLAIVILIVAAFFALAIGIVAATGAHFRLIDPLAAAIVSIGAGIAGILPIAGFRRSDPAGVFQLALIGTVLHLVVSVALAGTAIGIHLVASQMTFMYWLLGGYCVSLVALVWQLRRALFNTLGIKA